MMFNTQLQIEESHFEKASFHDELTETFEVVNIKLDTPIPLSQLCLNTKLVSSKGEFNRLIDAKGIRVGEFVELANDFLPLDCADLAQLASDFFKMFGGKVFKQSVKVDEDHDIFWDCCIRKGKKCLRVFDNE